MDTNIGLRFHRLIILKNALHKDKKHKKYTIECDCGVIKDMFWDAIRIGKIKSCGCYAREKIIAASSKHKDYGSKEYRAWSSAKGRCFNKNNVHYKIYGGRGITMCEKWRNSYSEFLKDMGRAPSIKHSIDRINVDGDYEPYNCRWATQMVQCNNTRANSFIEHNGEKKTIAEWARHFDIKYYTVINRIKLGWSLDDVFSKTHYRKKLTG